MNVREAIRISIQSGEMVSLAYLEDLTDQEMMHRPADECNHIKWQLGHLIVSEHEMVNEAVPDSMPALPEGFAQRYSRETVHLDDPEAFDSKDDLMAAFRAQREATYKALESLDDEAFDRPTGIEYAPTVGIVFSMQGSHCLMHAGQWAVIRRQLGKPPLF